MNHAALTDFWIQARRSLRLPEGTAIPEAWSFGDAPQMADQLLALVLTGWKTATAGALWEHEAGSEPLPVPGELSIILRGDGQPACVIEMTEVRVVPMSEVDASFAYDEGEGDRTLAWWRQAHEAFFRRHLHRIGREFAHDMPLVLQRFQLRFVPGSSALAK